MKDHYEIAKYLPSSLGCVETIDPGCGVILLFDSLLNIISTNLLYLLKEILNALKYEF